MGNIKYEDYLIKIEGNLKTGLDKYLPKFKGILGKYGKVQCEEYSPADLCFIVNRVYCSGSFACLVFDEIKSFCKSENLTNVTVTLEKLESTSRYEAIRYAHTYYGFYTSDFEMFNGDVNESTSENADTQTE